MVTEPRAVTLAHASPGIGDRSVATLPTRAPAAVGTRKAASEARVTVAGVDNIGPDQRRSKLVGGAQIVVKARSRQPLRGEMHNLRRVVGHGVMGPSNSAPAHSANRRAASSSP